MPTDPNRRGVLAMLAALLTGSGGVARPAPRGVWLLRDDDR